jgi:hypothetical protein
MTKDNSRQPHHGKGKLDSARVLLTNTDTCTGIHHKRLRAGAKLSAESSGRISRA